MPIKMDSEKKSINTAITDLLGFITEHWENKPNGSAIFLDLRKAFDSLNCKILHSKLQAIGLTGQAVCWLKSYLSERSQTVEIKTNIQNNKKAYRSSEK